MAASDVLQPYVDAPTLHAAEAELDRLADRGYALPEPLGDLYDELAHAAAEDDEYELAARLEAKALDTGYSQRFVAREMRGWYLLKAGATEDGEAVFGELLAERPDDADVRITLGHARSDAGFQDAALDAFDDALAAAKRRGFSKEIDHARVERRAEREHVGLELDEDDRLAPAPRPSRSGPIAWALAWFPPDQHAAALERWPDLADDLTDPVRYSRRIEEQLRTLHAALGHRPTVAPLIVDDFLAWATEEGYDPAGADARSTYAAALDRTGRATAWPPGRNRPMLVQIGTKVRALLWLRLRLTIRALSGAARSPRATRRGPRTGCRASASLPTIRATLRGRQCQRVPGNASSTASVSMPWTQPLGDVTIAQDHTASPSGAGRGAQAQACDGAGSGMLHVVVDHEQVWRCPAEPRSVRAMRDRVAAFARAHGLPDATLGDLRSCVSEAVTNAIVHAFRDGRPPGTVTVSARLRDDELWVRVVDDGMGLTPRADSPGLGFGLPMIAALCPSMTVAVAASGGTEVRMAFPRAGAPAGQALG